MRRGFFVLFFLAVASLTQGAAYLEQSHKEGRTAYVDPSLQGVEGQTAVIVTARDLETAVTAVAQVDGALTSQLWLIDAVSATLTPSQIKLLAVTPGIQTIIKDHTVQTAEVDPWEGWVTDRRTFIHQHSLDGPIFAPIIPLHDGGIFIVNEDGEVLTLNEDGTLRFEITLNSEVYRKPAVMDDEGIIYLASETRAYALDGSNGNILWQTDAPDKFIGGVALADGLLIVADEKERVYGLDLSNGEIQWTFTENSAAGLFLAEPAIAPNGDVTLLSEKGFLTILNAQTGAHKWTFNASEDGSPYAHPPQFDQSGNISFFGYEGYVYNLDSNGNQNYFKNLNDNLWSQSTLAADGTFFTGSENGFIKGIQTDGTLFFNKSVPDEDNIYTPIALSNDGSHLFVTVQNGTFHAYDISSKTRVWSYETEGDFLAGPKVASNGNVHIGDKEGNYVVLDEETGLVLYRYDGSDEFVTSPAISQNGSVFFHDKGNEKVIVLSRIPEGWSDQIPHVENTSDPTVYKVANPLSIDIGADIAHENGVTGQNISVAVVDSGVFFNDDTKDTLGTEVDQFLGQAEFVGPSNCSEVSVGSCFTDYTNSVDGYGHGTHVAGIIWNNVTDYYTGAELGIAPEANILSIRTLGDDGTGSYTDVIEGIQYVVANKETFNIRVMNLSLSAHASTPYFVDPLNRAVEEAWAAGIVVLAAAGNEGPEVGTITVPGNDPYIITVGALNSQKSSGYWLDDILAPFSSTGPTTDGFIKPDVVLPGGNVVSFMHNDGISEPDLTSSPYLVRNHPDHALSGSMFRMNGTSMATAVASGVVALMLDEDPSLTPDQVKFRLMYSAKPALDADSQLAYNPFQQGAGRVWVPDAIFNPDMPVDGLANANMDIDTDLAHGWMLLDEEGNPILDSDGNPQVDPDELLFHYQGAIRGIISDDGDLLLYYIEDPTESDIYILGAAHVSTSEWIDFETMMSGNHTFDQAGPDGDPWTHNQLWSSGGFAWSGGGFAWSGGGFAWSGGGFAWSGGGFAWSGGGFAWSGGGFAWSGGGFAWSGGGFAWSGGGFAWSGADVENTAVSSTTWVNDTQLNSPANEMTTFLPYIATQAP